MAKRKVELSISVEYDLNLNQLNLLLVQDSDIIRTDYTHTEKPTMRKMKNSNFSKLIFNA